MTNRGSLRNWLERARPPRRALASALVAGIVANATNVALFAGAIALLVESATRPGLRAVAVVLVVIELFAFLRAPLRFSERLAAHRLGYAAVSRWRRWLVETIGALDFAQWRAYATGDLLERALRDTDELQDLWLRFVVPATATLVVLLGGDLVVALLSPLGSWWRYAIVLLVLQLLGLATLTLLARREGILERNLRNARGAFRAQVVELAAATPELVLLGRAHLAAARLSLAAHDLGRAEQRLRHHRRSSNVVPLLVAVAALAAFATHPHASNVWLVVGVVMALVTFDALSALRASISAAVEVRGGGERLDALATTTRRKSRPWPEEVTLSCRGVRLIEDHVVLVDDATFDITPGSRVAFVGESGAGKSTLLRALAGLDDVAAGTVLVGDTPLRDIDEEDLRHHLTYVPSEPGFTRGFASDVVTLGRASTRDPGADLRALGLRADRTTRFGELSRGERGRVAIARALVTSPEIYLLDEPTAGLGDEETAAVLDLLHATSSTIVVATHDSLVVTWCDDVLELRDGVVRRVTR